MYEWPSSIQVICNFSCTVYWSWGMSFGVKTGIRVSPTCGVDRRDKASSQMGKMPREQHCRALSFGRASAWGIGDGIPRSASKCRGPHVGGQAMEMFERWGEVDYPA